MGGPGLDPRPVYVKFMVASMAMEQAVLPVLTVSLSASLHHCSVLIHWSFNDAV